MSDIRAQRTVIFPVPQGGVWKLITDYAAYPQYVGQIKEARCLEGEGAEQVVAFEISVLLKHFDYTLKFTAHPPERLEWTLVSSNTLLKNNGGWHLKPLGPDATEVSYWNEVVAKGFLPPAFLNTLIRLSLPRMLHGWREAAIAAHRKS